MGVNDEQKAIIDGRQGNIRNAIDREVSAELQAEWEGILSRLRAEVGETAFQSWLRPMRVHRFDADVVQISVPTRFMRDWAAAHYQDRLTELWHGENASSERRACGCVPECGHVYSRTTCSSRYSPSRRDRGSALGSAERGG